LRTEAESAEEALEHVTALAVAMLDAAGQQMAEALASRDIIGQAKGILMERCGVGAEDAFRSLKRASQRRHVKVRVLAEQVNASAAAGDRSLDEELCGEARADR
jgi:AmiR/NasT family two-component response regulator